MIKPKILTTMADYDRSKFLSDIFAGITVALVAIPLSLAIAIASGVPPQIGLVTAIVGGFLVSALGGSRVQIGGPTGAFIVVVFAIVQEHGYDGLLLATMMAGLLLVIGGFLRAGRLIALIPETVIEGFTIGIALLLVISQAKDLLGLDLAAWPVEPLEQLALICENLGGIQPESLIIGLIALLLIFGLRRVSPQMPSSLIMLGIIAFTVARSGLDVATIGSRFGDIPASFPAPHLPPISIAAVIELLPSALLIAFLAGVESLLSAIVADRMMGGQHRPSAELLAQGAANLASPLFGGIPVTGAIARTATNVRAGGKTPVAGIVQSLIILLVMMLAAPLAAYLPMSALAAVLFGAAWSMSEPSRWRERFELPKLELGLLLLTAVLTITASLSTAVAVGSMLGLALRLKQSNASAEPWTPSGRG